MYGNRRWRSASTSSRSVVLFSTNQRATRTACCSVPYVDQGRPSIGSMSYSSNEALPQTVKHVVVSRASRTV
jgi:hypothetical protein